MKSLAEWAASSCRPWCERCQEPLVETMESCVGCGWWWNGAEATEEQVAQVLREAKEVMDLEKRKHVVGPDFPPEIGVLSRDMPMQCGTGKRD